MASATPSGSTNRPGWWFGLSAKSTTVTPSGKGSPGVVRQSGLRVRAPPVSEPDRVFATVSLSRIADAAFAKIDILGLSVSQLVRPPGVSCNLFGSRRSMLSESHGLAFAARRLRVVAGHVVVW